MKSKFVSLAFDGVINDLSNLEKVRNGNVVKGSTNVRDFNSFRNCLSKFTKIIMNQDFNILTFENIDERFIQQYIYHLNGANVKNKIQMLRRIFRVAKVSTSVFDNLTVGPSKIKSKPTILDYTVIADIRAMDRSLLSTKEQFHIDLFLFSYYSGGSTISELAWLKHNSLMADHLYCMRTASEQLAIAGLCAPALEIIDTYKGKCFGDYLLPILTRKHNTYEQQIGKIKRLTEQVNLTLKKVVKTLNLKYKVTTSMTKRVYIEHMICNNVSIEMTAESVGCSIETVLHYREKTMAKFNVN